MEGYELYESKKWLSPSAACTFARCPRRHFYRSGCVLETPKKHIALKFGGCIHEAIPYAFKGDMQGAMEVFCKDWKEELQDDKRNVMRAKAMLENFAMSHSGEKSIYIPMTAPETRLKVDDHKGEYEVPFAVDIGLDIPLVGLIDCLARHRDTGKVWLVDFKTSNQLGAMFLQSFDLSPQVLTYCLAMKTLIPEEIEGMFIEGLLVAKVSCNTVVIPLYIKEFYYEETLSWLRRIHKGIRDCEEKEDFPKDFSGCNSYAMFGMPGFNCDYIDLCKTTPNWTDLLDLFVIGERKDTPF